MLDRTKRRIIGAAAFIAAALLPAIALAATAFTTGSLNMRAGPGTGYARITTLPPGARVDVRDCRGSWCRVVYAGYTGWVSANYLEGGGGYVQPPAAVPPVIVTPGWGWGWGWSGGWGGGYRPPYWNNRPPGWHPPGHRPPGWRPPPHRPPGWKPPPGHRPPGWQPPPRPPHDGGGHRPPPRPCAPGQPCPR